MEFHVKRFEEITNGELYEILKLRVDVFVVEQRCAYPDLDGRDRAALHVFCEEGGEILAYLRVLPEGEYFPDAAGIGRVIAKRRGAGLGVKILAEGVKAAAERWAAGASGSRRRATRRAFMKRRALYAARTSSTRTAYRTWRWCWTPDGALTEQKRKNAEAKQALLRRRAGERDPGAFFIALRRDGRLL